MAPCDRTDDAVHHKPIRLLEVLHGVLGLRSEDSVDVVGSQHLHASEDPLKSLHVVPAVAQFDNRWHISSAQFFCSVALEILLNEFPPRQRADDSVRSET